jgi:hypothetical protein
MRPGPALYAAKVQEAAVELVHRLAGVVLVHHGAQELDPGVDVRLAQRDVADPHVPARRGHHLHDPDRAGGAPGVLVELGFLIALGHEHEVVDVVAVAVLLEQLHRVLELRNLLARRRRLRPRVLFG